METNIFIWRKYIRFELSFVKVNFVTTQKAVWGMSIVSTFHMLTGVSSVHLHTSNSQGSKTQQGHKIASSLKCLVLKIALARECPGLIWPDWEYAWNWKYADLKRPKTETAHTLKRSIYSSPETVSALNGVSSQILMVSYYIFQKISGIKFKFSKRDTSRRKLV